MIVATLAVTLATVIVYHLAAPWFRSIAERMREWAKRPWRPALTFDEDTRTVVVPIRFGISVFANMLGSWYPVGVAAAVLAGRDDGTYDMQIAAREHPPVAELPDEVRAVVKNAIDLLHLVDDLDDPPIDVKAAAHELREAVGGLTH